MNGVREAGRETGYHRGDNMIEEDAEVKVMGKQDK